MACSLNKVKRDSLNHVRGIFNKDTRSTSVLSSGDISISYKKNINTALDLAKKRAIKVDEWSKNKFNSDNYKGQWTKIHKSPKDVRVELTFPLNLEQGYIDQIAQEDARTAQREDAKRAEIKYDDNYGFDFMPVTSDGYNYGLYLKNKVEMQKYISQRVSVLTEMSKKTKADEIEIVRLQEVSRRLNKDIKNLQSEPHVLQNFFNYFNNDLKIIEEILLENPSLNNLMAARDFINMMTFVYDVDGNTENEFIQKGRYTDIEDPATKKLFADFVAKRSDLDTKLREAELLLTTQQIDKTLEGEEENEKLTDDVTKLTKVVEKVKDIADIAKWLLPIDTMPHANPIQKFVKKIYDYAIGKKETFDLQQKLVTIKPKIEARLKQLGHTNNEGFINKLFSKVSYDIFKRKTKSGHRLVGKFSESWDALEDNIYKKFNSIQSLVFKKNKDVQDYNKIKQERKAVFLELEKNNVKFIDVRRIPELMTNPELQLNFGTFFIRDNAEDYKEEIIQSLIGESGNRKIAEKIYNETVKEQLGKITSFELSMEEYRSYLLKKNSVNSIDQLPDAAKNKLNEKYYTESPFAFAEEYEQNGNSNVRKPYYKDGKLKQGVDVSTMEYISYVPSNKEHFDSEFIKEIESDETLYETWDLLHEASKYINRNKNYLKSYDTRELDDTLNGELDMIQRHGKTIMSLTNYIGKETLHRLKRIISTSKFRDKTDLKLKGSVMSIDKAIQLESEKMLSMFLSEGYKPNQVVSIASLSTELQQILTKRIGLLPNTFKVADLVDKISEKKVLGSQKLDLVDTITSQLEIVEKFKAQKEIEAKLLFAKNQINRIKLAGNETERENSKQAIKHFIDMHLYGVNNRANWLYRNMRQSDKHLNKVFTVDEQETIASIDKSIAFIEARIPNLADDKLKNEALSAITSLQKFKESKGRVITSGSILELFAIKAPILVGLGLNVPSQMKNYFIGNLAGRQNDGLEWTEGNYHKANDYMKKWRIAWRKLTGIQKANYQLTNALVNGLNVFQNSANEIDRVRETNLTGVHKYISNPLHIVGEVEKTIQRPQILAMLGDTFITDSNGNKVSVFNANDTSNPHPAFHLVDGVLKLKPDFNTEENRSTWIKRNSDEYAALFSNSGKIPEIIARINGDYRATSIAIGKSTTLGAMAIMFKTWLPAYVMRRFGAEHGVISNLIKSDRGAEALTINAFTALTYGAIGAGVFFSPFITVGLAAGYLGRLKWKQSMHNDKNTILAFANEIQKELFSLKFYIRPVRYAVAVSAKVAQQTVYRVSGKQLMSNDAISDIAGFKQAEGETTDEFDRSKARLQFLLTEVSTSVSLLMLKIVAQMLLFPPDDEDDKYKDESDFFKRAKNHPDITLYYGLENLLTGMANDVNLLNDPLQMSKMLLDGSHSDFYTKVAAVLTAANNDEDEYLRGPNKGKNRVGVQLKKMLVPKGMQSFTLGFKTLTNQDYNPSDMVNKPFISDYKTLNKRRLKMQSDRKKELYDQYIEQGRFPDKETAKKVAKKVAEKEFYGISKFFNPDGSVKQGYEYIVEKYRE